MNVEQFLALLEAHPNQHLQILLPNGKAIAPHFHITEVGHVVKNFMDCGGTLRKTEACLLQTWVFVDLQHRLETTKLANILRVAGDVLPSLDLPVEIEHESETVSQYPVISGHSDGQTLTLSTGHKHTACLAMDVCCAPSAADTSKAATNAACCTPNGGCC